MMGKGSHQDRTSNTSLLANLAAAAGVSLLATFLALYLSKETACTSLCPASNDAHTNNTKVASPATRIDAGKHYELNPQEAALISSNALKGILPPLIVDNTIPRTRPVAVQSLLFTAEECQRIMGLASEHLTLTKSEVGSGKDPKNYPRISVVAAMPKSSVFSWVYQRVYQRVLEFNKEKWGYPLPSTFMSNRVEALQFGIYDSKVLGKYDWHMDIGAKPTTSWRLLSVSIQLSDEATYEGGNLQLLTSGEPTNLSKTQGMALIFQSNIVHRVTPVTKGARCSLVMWIEEGQL